jgi:hypothetical protein
MLFSMLQNKAGPALNVSGSNLFQADICKRTPAVSDRGAGAWGVTRCCARWQFGMRIMLLNLK